jgi:hypothetical protein
MCCPSQNLNDAKLHLYSTSYNKGFLATPQSFLIFYYLFYYTLCVLYIFRFNSSNYQRYGFTNCITNFSGHVISKSLMGQNL